MGSTFYCRLQPSNTAQRVEEIERGYTAHVYREIIPIIFSDHLGSVSDCLYILRRAACSEAGVEVYEELIKGNSVPRLLFLLELHHRPDIQFEASWLLRDIVAYIHDENLDCAVLTKMWPVFISVLQTSTDYYAIKRTVWALANMPGDRDQLNQTLVEEGFVPPLVRLIDSDISEDLSYDIDQLVNTMLDFSGLSVEQMLLRRSIIKQLLVNRSTHTAAMYACWSLRDFTDEAQNAEDIRLVVDSGIVKSLVEILNRSECLNLLCGALRVVENTGHLLTEEFADSGIQSAFKRILSDNRLNSLEPEVFRAISMLSLPVGYPNTPRCMLPQVG